ncbi:two-component system, response regulator YesN [Paenibacillus sp. UNCCL117]|uniref:response regulator n=1 Tax=unclassified Paenibacillus TaxID=185978 RepID=UPI00088BBBE2|nr:MULTISPECIES: response regulator [unclassified Paenibacillus]SDD56410.1 two component transcriptional regulator, AraC family [Paenibacillus sp. cl123]SFW51393.1 two-component system, response regulator YesN [Paenibacillus sp. UNCCL117]
MPSIYVLDDEPMIVKGLKVLIDEYNRFSEVVTFTDSAAAFARIEAEPPDIVITDIRMPRMDGLELCRLIHAKRLPVKVIVLSGYGDFSYAQKCLSYGVKEYLLKPVTELELYPVFDKLLREQGTATMSFARFERWVDELEEAVWTLNHDRAAELLMQGRSELASDETDTRQLRQRAADGINLLARKLSARGVHHFQPALSPEPGDNATIDWLTMEASVDAWMKKLSELRGSDRVPILEAAFAYIDSHLFEEDVTLEKVADRLGITPTYFSHFFKKNTNETFVQYRLRKRLEKAKQLLAIPHYKIIDIMVEVGYDSYPHFSRIFKKSTGQSPTEYRSTLGIK